jgi:hypothetical protein
VNPYAAYGQQDFGAQGLNELLGAWGIPGGFRSPAAQQQWMAGFGGLAAFGGYGYPFGCDPQSLLGQQQPAQQQAMMNITLRDFHASPFERWRRAALRPDPAIATPLRDKSWLMLVLPLAAGLVYSMAFFLVNS